MNTTDSALNLNKTVINGGYCIGCGACAYKDDADFSVKLNKYGNYVAELKNEILVNDKIDYLSICPFSGVSKNEDEINDRLYEVNPNKSRDLGNFINCYAGYVKEGEYRRLGSSGGFGKWIGATLLDKGMVDYVLQIGPNDIASGSSEPLFKYKLYSEGKDVITGSKSSYYPNSLLDVLNEMKKNKGRYLVTGVPCFIKTLRLISLTDNIISSRLTYTLGIICGGMKSANQAKMIGWQMGVHPKNIKAIDFRRKHKDQPASNKVYQVWSNTDNEERFVDANELYGTDYGASYFKPKACDYCDDMVGETADISVGDAWIKKYSQDPKGNSLLIVRNENIDEVLNKALSLEKINIDKISEQDAYAAQAGGFRHRRDALSRRLLLKEKNGEWYPKKRVEPGQAELSEKRKKIYDLREKIANVSHEAFFKGLNENSLDTFYSIMEPLDKEYKKLTGISFARKIMRSTKRFIVYKVLNRY